MLYTLESSDSIYVLKLISNSSNFFKSCFKTLLQILLILHLLRGIFSMNDTVTTIQDLKKRIESFIQERDWEKFHNPKNLSMVIATEAAELMELFLWVNNEESKEALKQNQRAVEEEMVDVLWGILCLANRANIDITTAFEEKIKKNALKYPAGQKYTVK